MEPKTRFRTVITYVVEETGEVIDKQEAINNFIIISKIKENVTKRNGNVRIEWTYTLKSNPQLKIEFPD